MTSAFKEGEPESVEEMQSWIDKLRCEGGVVPLLQWGGVAEFPPSIRGKAMEVQNALDLLDAAIVGLCGVRGLDPDE